MVLAAPVTTDAQLSAENFILSICIDKRLSASDLDRVAHRLADIQACADARTDKGNQYALSRS